MRNIIKAEDLPYNETVYLKKDIFGWRVVTPWKDDSGKINWFILFTGGWRNIIMTLILIGLVLGFIWAYSHDINVIQEHYAAIAKDPIAFCKGLYGPSIADQEVADLADKLRNFEINFS